MVIVSVRDHYLRLARRLLLLIGDLGLTVLVHVLPTRRVTDQSDRLP